MVPEALDAAVAGLPLALAYNPLAAAFAVPVAAGLLGARGASHDRVVWAFSVGGFAWLFGDGLRALARARDTFDAASTVAPAWPLYTTIGVWALGTLVLGYVLPVWAGTFVGRRVTHGTGWVAAASIALAASLAVSGMIGTLAG